MKLLCITIAIFLTGLCVGYVETFKSMDLWSGFYYVWDKSKDLLFVLTLIQFITNKKIRSGLWWLCSFCILRIIWDIIAIHNYEQAISPTIMLMMFLAWAVIIAILIYQGITQEWQRS